jgi:hypothetical protein
MNTMNTSTDTNAASHGPIKEFESVRVLLEPRTEWVVIYVAGRKDDPFDVLVVRSEKYPQPGGRYDETGVVIVTCHHRHEGRLSGLEFSFNDLWEIWQEDATVLASEAVRRVLALGGAS